MGEWVGVEVLFEKYFLDFSLRGMGLLFNGTSGRVGILICGGDV
jgi:hypothetical protein